MKSGSRQPSRAHLALIATLLIAAAVRVAYLAEYQGTPEWDQLTVDNYYHHNWAQDIAGGNYLGDTTYFRAPAYVFCLAILYTIFGPSILAARLFGMAVGLGSVFMTFLLGTRIFDRKTGLVAALIQAVYPVTVYFEGELLLDPLFMLLLQAALYKLLGWYRNRTTGDLTAAGLFMGLAVITRPTALVLVPVMLVLVLWQRRQSIGVTRQAVTLLVAVAVPVAPVFARNLAVADDPVVVASQGGINLYIGNNDQADGLSAVMPEPLGYNWQIRDITHIAETHSGKELKPGEVSSYWTGRAVDWIAGHPAHFITLYLKKIYFSLSNLEISNNRSLASFFRKIAWLKYNPISFGLIFPFAVIGGLAAYRQNRSVRIVLLMMSTYILATSLFFFTSRFRLPLLPYFVILAVSGARASWGITRKSRAATAALATSLFVLAGFSFFPIVALPRGYPAQELASKGLYHYSKSDYQQALAYYRQAWRIDPEYPESSLNLGACFFRLGIADSALHYFERERRLHPQRAKAYTNLASYYLVNNQHQQAGVQARKALAIKPHDLMSGTILLRATMADTSISTDSLWRAANRLAMASDNDPGMINEAAGFLIRRGETEKTASLLRLALRGSPPPIEMDDLAFGSQFHASRGRFRKEKAKSHLLTGYVHGLQGAYGESIRYSHTAINMDPDLAEAYANLISGYLAIGQVPAADSVLTTALARFPDNGSIRELQRALRQ